MTSTKWRMRFGDEAQKDFARILKYTKDKFGPQQADIYRITLLEALAALKDGPDVPGSASREEILPNLRTLHVGRQGRRGRHFIMYRTIQEQVIEIIRILHDAMDLARHLPPEIN